MKLLQVAEQNKKYYTKEFIHGFNTGAKTQYEADKKDVRHGRWIEHKSKYFMKCSVCGALWDKDLTMNKYFNHCPKCGAKMDEVEE